MKCAIRHSTFAEKKDFVSFRGNFGYAHARNFPSSFLIKCKFDLKDFYGRLCLTLEISMVVPLANLTLEISVVILYNPIV